MLSLALYCDQIIPKNEAIDRRLLAMIETKGSGEKIAYISSGPEPDRKFFEERKSYYKRYGLDLSLFFDPVSENTEGEINALFACDAIHLSGGHTGLFLARLKRGGMLGPLRDWAAEGGTLIGTSAGAILMTPTIATDAVFSGGRPEEVKDAHALALVPFEFFPHLGSKPSYFSELLRYSRFTLNPIVACNDGDGVVVWNGMVECIGEPVWIVDGAVRKIDEVILDGFRIVTTPR